MPIRSAFFSKNTRHQACQTKDSSHYVLGESGPHIADVQAALNLLDSLFIEESEREARRYGKSTAAAVLAFKRKRKIVNRTYQTSEDDIVGKMTITALDNEVALLEAAAPKSSGECARGDARSLTFAPRSLRAEDGITLRLLTDEERDIIA